MLEDAFGAFMMGIFVRGEDKEVIHINDKPSFCDHIPEGVVHESLERCWGVGKSEEHYSWFKKSLVHDEGSFPLVAICDVNIVIPPVDIELGEQFGILELVDEVGDKRKWVGISGGMFVQVAVVLTGVETAIFLLNKEEWGHLGGIRRTDLSTVKVFLEEVFSGFSFLGG